MDEPAGAADVRELGFALGLDQVEKGYGSVFPLPKDRGRVVGGEDFVPPNRLRSRPADLANPRIMK